MNIESQKELPTTKTLPNSHPAPLRTILYVDHTAKLGGGEIALLNLVSAIDPSRYRPIVVLAAEGPLTAKLRDASIETHVLPLNASVLNTRKDSLHFKSLLRLGDAFACLRYSFRLAFLARRLKVDLIHTNSLKSDLYGGLAGRLAGIPVLWHVRDNIDENYLPPLVAATFRGLSRILPHAVIANSESTLRTLRPLQRQTTATVYSGVAQGALAWAEENNESKLRVVHDGFSSRSLGPLLSPQEAPRPTTPGGADDLMAEQKGPIVVLVGRIAEWKGQHVFLQAAAQVRDRFPAARFQVVGAPLFGEEAYEQSLHQMAGDLGVSDQVQFLGFRDDVFTLLLASDIVVHASILGEPFGQVVIEGMAAGKPVIATDGGALPEIVARGETGLLVPMGDVSAMAEAIVELLSEPARAAAMGIAGRKRVQEKFTIAHTIRKLESVYDYLLNTGVSDPV